MIPLIYVGCLGLVNGVSQVLMRLGGRNSALGEMLVGDGTSRHLLWWSGLMVSWACGLTWAWLVTRVKLGSAMPIFAGAAYLSAALGAHFWLKEGLTPKDAIGFLLVISGIAVLLQR